MINVAINGAAGRMGRRLVDLVSHEQGMRVVAALEQPGHPNIGTDIGELAGCARLGLKLSDEWTEHADVMIDFSSPAGTMARLHEAVSHRTALLVGTTGLTGHQRVEIGHAAKHIPVLIASNMSLGVNLMFLVAAQIAEALGVEYDIEIVEAHHRFKKDAPSGTALTLADHIAAATGRKLSEDVIYGRHGASAERKPGEIAVHAVRGGDIVGDHTVMYTTLGERIELTHRAHTRDTFVRGAIHAAKFLFEKKPAVYTMRDVLGL